MGQQNEQSAEADVSRWSHDFDEAALALEHAGPNAKALRAVVDLMRRSPLPTLVAWGPQLRILYNEAFVPVLGPREAALGERMQDVWAREWPSIAPTVQRALDGQPSGFDDLPVVREAASVSFNYVGLDGLLRLF